MGKYTEQAGSYSQGMKFVETALTNALEELKNVRVSGNDEKLDTLGRNTNESIDLIIASIDSLLGTISSNKQKLMNKGIEIDKRIADENARKKQAESLDAKEQSLTEDVVDLSNKLRMFNLNNDSKIR